jgi:cyclic pyranopterin phosphate synthase
MTDLTHFDEHGASRMVDVGAKEITHRMARAESFVVMQTETLKLIIDRRVAKGDVLEVARLAGIMATKRTADVIRWESTASM